MSKYGTTTFEQCIYAAMYFLCLFRRAACCQQSRVLQLVGGDEEPEVPARVIWRFNRWIIGQNGTGTPALDNCSPSGKPELSVFGFGGRCTCNCRVFSNRVLQRGK